MLSFKPIHLTLLFALAIAGCGGTPAGEDAGDPDAAFLRGIRADETASSGGSTGGSGMMRARASKIELETDHFEMGTISYKGKTTRSMKIYNRGTTDLRISRVTTTCGCTTGRLKGDIISPGQSAILEIVVDPSMIPGPYTTKTLTIFSNDPANPYSTVDVTTYVESEIEFIPEEIKGIEVAQGQGFETEFRVRPADDYAFEIDSTEIYEKSPYFTASLREVPKAEWADPDRREYIVKATVLPGIPPGDYEKVLYVHSNLEYQPDYAIPFEIDVR